MENNYSYHIPVLLDECINALSITPDGTYIDVTFGGGGHSRRIHNELSEDGRLISFDQDLDAQKNTWDSPNFTFVAANFEHLTNHLRLLGVSKVDGILADLGVSSHQFDELKRGFSFRGDAKLDMRMNQKANLSAQELVNSYSEEELVRVFRSYGEVKNPRKLALVIIAARLSKKIITTGQFSSIIEECAPKHREHKYFAQVFQAIRIEVNQEMRALETFLLQCEKVIKPRGRLVIMSYHSLEDRLVKNFMKRGSLSGEITKDFYGNLLKPFTEVLRKPIIPNEAEIEKNSRARSAKLRIAERDGE